MRIAVMQPYFFPYLGYFHLLDAVDCFITLEDVAFPKRGWVHRNRLFLNGNFSWFTIPIKYGHRSISETEICKSEYVRWKDKFYRTLEHFYKKSPYYSLGMEIVENTFSNKTMNIAELSKTSLESCCALLEIETKMKSSLNYTQNWLDKEERIISICHQEKANIYVNAIGGVGLYSHEKFKTNDIDLKFIHSEFSTYSNGKIMHPQLLSILDVIMCCGREKIKDTFIRDYYVA